MPYRIINWDKYQARTDRKTSPWVKLWKDLINSADFYSIPEKRRWEWPILLLLSKNHDGTINETDADLGFILYKTLDRPFDSTPFIGKLLSRSEQEQEKEEEKEQEEESVPTGSQVVTTGNHPDTTGDQSITIGVFPTKEGDWAFTQANLEILESAYGFDSHPDWVFDECKAAKAWLLAKPERLKTKRGMMAYLNSWVKRAKDDGGPFKGERKRMAIAGEADRDQARRHRRNGKSAEVESIGKIIGASHGEN